MSQVFNFSAGPAMLPSAVMAKAQAEMLDFDGCGMSVMELSHRSKTYVDIAERAEASLRSVLAVPDNYKVLFLQGGASLQFAAVPINLLRGKTAVDYVNTGQWSKKAIKEAQRFAQVNVAASSEDDGFNSVPAFDSWSLNSDAAYVHYTPNETIGGVEFHQVPDTGDVPKVVDMSSTILSRPINVSDYGLIYAGAQKNIGPAGLTLVIVREDLIGEPLPGMPSLLDYAAQAKADSMLNTPPTYAWYLAGLVFDWIAEQGGLEAMARLNKAKSDALYSAIDGSDFYANPVAVANRSWMNVPFTLADDGLDKAFLEGAQARGLTNLKGHRSVGGMRASIYNAMPMEGVQALLDYMNDFARDKA